MNKYTTQDIEKLLNDNNVSFSKVEDDALDFFTIYTKIENDGMIKTANRQHKEIKKIEQFSINKDVSGVRNNCYYRQVKAY